VKKFWIEFHTGLISHFKLKRLMRSTGWSQDTAIGKLCRLWAWAIEYAEDGDLNRFHREEIMQEIGIEEDADNMYLRFIHAEFINPNNLIHDWLDYAGLFLIRTYASSRPGKEKLKEIWAKHGRMYGESEQNMNTTQTQRKRNAKTPRNIESLVRLLPAIHQLVQIRSQGEILLRKPIENMFSK